MADVLWNSKIPKRFSKFGKNTNPDDEILQRDVIDNQPPPSFSTILWPSKCHKREPTLFQGSKPLS